MQTSRKAATGRPATPPGATLTKQTYLDQRDGAQLVHYGINVPKLPFANSPLFIIPWEVEGNDHIVNKHTMTFSQPANPPTGAPYFPIPGWLDNH